MIALVLGPNAHGQARPVRLTVGHVNHDHQIALYVAADNSAAYEKESGLALRMVEDRRRYELFDRERKVADVDVVVVGGGSRMPTALSQGVIDVGLGSTVATLAAVDSEAPVRLIAPLHRKGDMLAVKPALTMTDWTGFVVHVKASPNPVRIGYKDPISTAKVIFEQALKHEGLAFSGDMSRSDVKVHMINVKGGERLNFSVGAGLVDGYVGNNPFPAIGVEKGICRIVCDLETLPPGKFRDHPCCCVGGNVKAIREKTEAVTALLALLVQATETINKDPALAVKTACRWLGTSEAVERESIPTSGYSMDVSADWHDQMATWVAAMNDLGVFNLALKGKTEADIAGRAYELTLLQNAVRRLRAGTGNP
jgi:NitT/TauT family transport system substrate-binding protein